MYDLAQIKTRRHYMTTTTTTDIKVRGAVKPGFERILTDDALAFVAELERKFGGRRRELLAARAERQKRFDAGEVPDFLPETKSIREGDWKVAPIPKDLLDRRVEITGPVDNRKMVINALNSGAQSYMTDFEDAAAPSWDNMIGGQINLIDYWDGKIGFTDEANGKTYNVADKHAVLNVRPRGRAGTSRRASVICFTRSLLIAPFLWARATVRHARVVSCVVNALVEATPISGPARVRSTLSLSRSIVLSMVFRIDVML